MHNHSRRKTSAAVIRKRGPPLSFLPRQRRWREDREERPGCQRTSPGRSLFPGSSSCLLERRRGCGTTGPWRGAGAWGGWRGRRLSPHEGWSSPCWGLGRRRWGPAWVGVECYRMRGHGLWETYDKTNTSVSGRNEVWLHTYTCSARQTSILVLYLL